MQDRDLLLQFVQTRSEHAFAQLVRRHMDAVYCSARRQVRDNQLAEDVAQAVFFILARKAAKLQDRDSIAGWLMKTTHLASLDAIKIESRRKRYEQHAAMLAQSCMEQNMTPSAEIMSELDHAISRLNESDRSIVALRYLLGKTTGETAESIGISEPTAAKRITRAVDRLRKILLARRVIAPTVALAVILDQIPRVAAPDALADTASIAATAGTTSPAGLSIAKGVLNIMMFHKVVAAMLLIAALGGITGLGVGAVKLLADENIPAAATPSSNSAASLARQTVFRGRLSNGVSIEIIGISEHPSIGKQWWFANGDLRATPPFKSEPFDPFGQQSIPAGFVTREFAAQINNIVNGSIDHATVGWGETNIRQSSTDEVGDQRGRKIPGKSVAWLSDSPGGATVHADVAAGKWDALGVAGLDGCSLQALTSGPKLLIISRSYTVVDETHVMVVWEDLPHLDTRIVAIDRAGKTVLARSVTNAGDGATTFAGEYSVDLPLNLIQQWQLQARPFDQWIEIRGISLHPGQKTNVTIVTSDDRKNP